MGSMNLSTMRDALQWALDNRTNITSTQMNRWLNWSYLQVSMPNVHRHQALQGDTGNSVTLVANQVTYDLPKLLGYSFWGIHSVWYVAGSDASDRTTRRQRLKGGFDIRGLDENTLGSGPPTRYALWGQTTSTTAYGPVLNVNVRPSAAEAGHVLLVRGYKMPELLTSGSQFTVLHPLWDEVIILGATYRGFRELSENARAEVAKVNFAAMIQEVQEATKLDAEDWGGSFEVDYQFYMPVS